MNQSTILFVIARRPMPVRIFFAFCVCCRVCWTCGIGGTLWSCGGVTCGAQDRGKYTHASLRVQELLALRVHVSHDILADHFCFSHDPPSATAKGSVSKLCLLSRAHSGVSVYSRIIQVLGGLVEGCVGVLQPLFSRHSSGI
jgi:hypothetical protein